MQVDVYVRVCVYIYIYICVYVSNPQEILSCRNGEAIAPVPSDQAGLKTMSVVSETLTRPVSVWVLGP